MQASIGQYSMQAGEPAHPVQQSVVIAKIRGLFLRVALPSPSDMGQCLSMMSYKLFIPRVYMMNTPDSNIALGMGKAMGGAVGGALGAAGGATLGAAATSLLVPGVGPVTAGGIIGAALLGAAARLLEWLPALL